MTVAAMSRFGQVADGGVGRAPFPVRAVPFIWHYILRRRWLFAGLFVLRRGLSVALAPAGGEIWV